MGIIYLKGNWIMMERRSEMVSEMRIVYCNDEEMGVVFEEELIVIRKENFEEVYGMVVGVLRRVGIEVDGVKERMVFGSMVISELVLLNRKGKVN
jgi:hypothetical protein